MLTVKKFGKIEVVTVLCFVLFIVGVVGYEQYNGPQRLIDINNIQVRLDESARGAIEIELDGIIEISRGEYMVFANMTNKSASKWKSCRFEAEAHIRGKDADRPVITECSIYKSSAKFLDTEEGFITFEYDPKLSEPEEIYIVVRLEERL